ncbi:MAG TPA: hypothetical protein VGH98_02320 [Gemmatimonadaceae bacterium]
MSHALGTVPRRKMSAPLACHRTTIVCVALVVVNACENRRGTPAIDSSVPLRPANIGTTGAPATTTWDARLGPVLLISGPSPDLATIVVGDSSRAGGDTVTESEAIAIRSTSALLIGRGDSVQIGILQEVHSPKGEEDSECTGWPAWKITSAKAGGALSPWSVGFVGATVQPIRMDSIESLSRVDSARLAADVTRLASTLPGGGGERFTGLPFTVTSLWRFRAGPAAEGVVANLVRHVNQEARPLEERTLVIAERDSTRRDERFILAYYDRSQGAEETVESRDALALARATPDAQPMLVVGRDYGDGMAYALIQRDPSGRWRDKWHSPRGHCK